jgi:hypothetical protein
MQQESSSCISFPLVFAAMRQNRVYANNKQYGSPVTPRDVIDHRPTNGDGASGDANGADANPSAGANAAGANAIACASGGANGPAPASDDRPRPGKR